jgi:hypothetical protein
MTGTAMIESNRATHDNRDHEKRKIEEDEQQQNGK